jgi:hypothetical protein
MVVRSARVWLLLTLTALQPACGAGWRRIHRTAPSSLSPRQQIQLWSHGRPHRWHAVQWRTDSVSGIPFMQPIACDSCRQSVPQTEVDSVRVGNPTAGFWRSVGLTLAIMAVVGFATCNCPND